MNFEHTESRRMLADTLDRFISDQYGISLRNTHAYSKCGRNPELYAQLAELGVVGALFPESHEGFGGEGFDIQVVFESLGRGLVVEPFLDILMVGRALLAFGTEKQKALVPEFIAGRKVTAFAHDEPDSFHELSNVATSAHRVADGWLLNGSKSAVAFGDTADLLLVSARISGDVLDEEGISLFLVPGDTSGISAHSHGRIDGGRVAELIFKDVKLPSDALVGEVGNGFSVLEHAAGWGVLALCAEALGSMRVVVQNTLEFLQTRKQFGVPVGSFQALQHRMVDILIEVEQADSAVINLASTIDSTDRVARERAVSAAKYTIGRIGTLIAEEGIQIHGGIGMTWEFPLSHYAKRLIMLDHQLGDEDHHIARYSALGL